MSQAFGAMPGYSDGTQHDETSIQGNLSGGVTLQPGAASVLYTAVAIIVACVAVLWLLGVTFKKG